MNNNPAIMKVQLEAQKLQQDKIKSEREFMVDMKELEFKEKEVLAKLKMDHDDNQIKRLKADTERFAKQVDLRLKHKDMGHRHLKEAIETHHKGLETKHKISQPSQGQGA